MNSFITRASVVQPGSKLDPREMHDVGDSGAQWWQTCQLCDPCGKRIAFRE